MTKSQQNTPSMKAAAADEPSSRNHHHQPPAAATTTTTTTNKQRSKKQRNKPILASKLHELPVIKPTGIGSAIAALPNRALGQGKRNVWVGKERCAQIRRTRQEQRRPTKTPVINNDVHPTLRPTLEGLRAAWIFKLRKLFRDECGTFSPPALSFERWFQTNEMLYQEKFEAKKREKMTWSAITSGTSSAPASIILKADMVRASMDPAEAERIVCAMYDSTAAASQDMAAKRTELERGIKVPSRVMVARHRHTLDLCLSDNTRHLLKLNHEHYDKLLALWELNREHDDDINTNKNENNNNNNETAFHNDLYSLLARYYSIQGPGFQAACPERVFDVLHSCLDVQHECFASPLNCYYGSFCSAFLDVDGPFGTSGSFWDFYPEKGGSFQANPPFVHHVMVAMVDKMESLLLSLDVPFSFVVIVPVWLEESSYQSMCNSPFKMKHWIIAKADHGFCDGAQHQRRDRYRVSPYDTAIFILQNKAGSIKYIPSTTLEQELREAFASGVPTEAAIERRKRDGRGETDEDGGGGVYKGKKRNRTGAGVVQRKIQERTESKQKKKKQRK